MVTVIIVLLGVAATVAVVLLGIREDRRLRRESAAIRHRLGLGDGDED